MSAEGIRIVRVLPAAPDEVFRAWTDPEAMRIWMCPGDIVEAIVELDLRVGGRFAINMRTPRGDDLHTGEYVAIEPPRRLAFTWRSAGTRAETLVTLTLAPHGNGACELVLTHERLPEGTVDSHRLGWKAHVRKLYEYLEAASRPSI